MSPPGSRAPDRTPRHRPGHRLRRPPDREQGGGSMSPEEGKTVAAYGSWRSPLAIDRMTEGVVFLAEPRAVRGVRWWIEGRPEEDGRQVLVRRDPDGTVTRLTPAGFNARSRVHEYGGAGILISGDLVVVSDFATGRLNRVLAPEQLEPLTPDRAWRFADMEHDPARNRL